jgi:hypothetical protein
MPALAIEMVCCSIASWRMERVESDICGAVEYHVSIVTNYICIYCSECSVGRKGYEWLWLNGCKHRGYSSSCSACLIVLAQ